MNWESNPGITREAINEQVTEKKFFSDFSDVDQLVKFRLWSGTIIRSHDYPQPDPYVNTYINPNDNSQPNRNSDSNSYRHSNTFLFDR